MIAAKWILGALGAVAAALGIVDSCRNEGGACNDFINWLGDQYEDFERWTQERRREAVREFCGSLGSEAINYPACRGWG